MSGQFLIEARQDNQSGGYVNSLYSLDIVLSPFQQDCHNCCTHTATVIPACFSFHVWLLSWYFSAYLFSNIFTAQVEDRQRRHHGCLRKYKVTSGIWMLLQGCNQKTLTVILEGDNQTFTMIPRSEDNQTFTMIPRSEHHQSAISEWTASTHLSQMAFPKDISTTHPCTHIKSHMRS